MTTNEHRDHTANENSQCIECGCCMHAQATPEGMCPICNKPCPFAIYFDAGQEPTLPTQLDN